MLYYTMDFDRLELRRKINEMMKEFPERTRIIFYARLKYDISYRQLAEELGITLERVRQIHLKTLRMLKHPTRSKILRQFTIYGDDVTKNAEKCYLDDKVHLVVLEKPFYLHYQLMIFLIFLLL